MKQNIVIESTNAKDWEQVYEIYYRLKDVIENNQTVKIKLQFEIEII